MFNYTPALLTSNITTGVRISYCFELDVFFLENIFDYRKGIVANVPLGRADVVDGFSHRFCGATLVGVTQ